MAVLLLSACVSKVPAGQRALPRSVAIIGVTVAPGVNVGKGQVAMAREFQELIHDREGYRTLRSTAVQRSVNSVSPNAYQDMMANFAAAGELRPNDIRALVAGRMPVQMGLIARIEQNNVEAGQRHSEQLRNNSGEILSDRERVVLTTVRRMRMKTSMINMSTGAVFWTRTYESAPVTKSSYVHYSGSSFSGSLAAALANTMSNGIRAPQGPLPPSNQLTLRSLMREVVRNLPGI